MGESGQANSLFHVILQVFILIDSWYWHPNKLSMYWEMFYFLKKDILAVLLYGMQVTFLTLVLEKSINFETTKKKNSGLKLTLSFIRKYTCFLSQLDIFSSYPQFVKIDKSVLIL